jgi:uncharacterized protein (DUF305 family)
MKHVNRTTVATATLVITAALGVAGCGNDSDSGSMPGMDHGSHTPAPSSTATEAAFNDADVTFASQMILHHQQAVQVASMAGYQATTPTVKQLASAIKAAQGHEMQQMSGWLTSWGKPVPSPSHGGHDMSESMPGMMTEDEMSELGNAKGAMFDRMWTLKMINHHGGAVTGSKTEQTTGKNTAAIALAKKIETDRTKEIATMHRLLGQLPAR